MRECADDWIVVGVDYFEASMLHFRTTMNGFSVVAEILLQRAPVSIHYGVGGRTHDVHETRLRLGMGIPTTTRGLIV